MKTVEERIIGAVWGLLLGGVNEVLAEIDDFVPPVERPGAGLAARPARCAVEIAAVERTEKERIVRLDACRVKIMITAFESDCYRYAYALEKAIDRDFTLGGVVENVLFEKKVYTQKTHLVEAEFGLRITVEQLTMRNERGGFR
jgi:hypothetical protein